MTVDEAKITLLQEAVKMSCAAGTGYCSIRLLVLTNYKVLLEAAGLPVDPAIDDQRAYEALEHCY